MIPQPAWNQATLKAIKAESDTLMATHPVNPPKNWVTVPQDEWPPAIAKLQPEMVTVYNGSVNILTKPFFDGGWGYGVPQSGKVEDLGMLPQCWSEVSRGVFWHGPC
ncbi:MAG: hypothetical protein V4808_08240 [Pseudomonadota bacterium]